MGKHALAIEIIGEELQIINGDISTYNKLLAGTRKTLEKVSDDDASWLSALEKNATLYLGQIAWRTAEKRELTDTLELLKALDSGEKSVITHIDYDKMGFRRRD